ncbi:hypothetical protein BTE48_09115 [Oceanospirillum multiglobuliferum]|uniref:Lactam utilization protein LamB n=1 Tax=Oceanospirillum multiglobuliferum TaxID=64969 RepID=A0A1V4T5F8_9GAMM|nr:hypothetical protein BTE48_09115 [Oceanospirillum multiglobuliferum]
MKLNCDMGESFGAWTMGADAEVMPYIDMASIACGFHASDPLTMHRTVQLALQHQVSIGAHPSYPDLVGFGRREMQLSSDELHSALIYQIAALQGICESNNTTLSYVKPHGALYNKMMIDNATLMTVMQSLKDYCPHLPLVLMATPEAEQIQKQADSMGISILFEVFADRAYDDEGRLVARTIEGAVHQSLSQIEQQVRQIVEQGTVTSFSGKVIPIAADTLCIHGDGAHAASIAELCSRITS